MRKALLALLILALLILLVSVPSFAGGGATMMMLMGSPPTGGGSCTMGATGEPGSSGGVGVDISVCRKYTASCSGTLSTASLRHMGLNADNAKICIYSDEGGGTLGAGDNKIGCSDAMSSSATEWKSASIAGSITTGSDYWLCIAADGTDWDGDKAAVVGSYYDSTSPLNIYDNVPADLTGTWTADNNREYSAYVTITY